jgi:phage/plasmid-like protein (TIGR03299 family)
METNQILNQAFSGLKLQDPANAERVSNLLEEFELRWTVSKQKLFLEDGTETNYMAVVRDDNKDVFQTCKDSYQPYQNSELAELLIRIADVGGYKIHGGGMFNNGRKVYTQLESGNTLKGIGINNDSIIGYISGINSHDGSTSLKWGSSNTTISCQNTFNAVAKQLANTARHTNNMYNKVDAYLREIGFAIEQEKSIFDKFIRLSEMPVKQNHITRIVKEVTGVDIMLTESEAESKFSTYSINRSQELLESISKEMEQKGKTRWGLFSGVTNYTTHTLPVPKRDNARLESKFIGTGGLIDNKVFDLIESLN